jgi:hypothetical protein
MTSTDQTIRVLVGKLRYLLCSSWSTEFLPVLPKWERAPLGMLQLISNYTQISHIIGVSMLPDFILIKATQGLKYLLYAGQTIKR